MVTWNCLSMFSTRLTGSGATALGAVWVDGAGIRMDGMELLGLARAVADGMTVVLARVIPPRGSGSIETVEASVVIELIRAASFLG